MARPRRYRRYSPEFKLAVLQFRNPEKFANQIPESTIRGWLKAPHAQQRDEIERALGVAHHNYSRLAEQDSSKVDIAIQIIRLHISKETSRRSELNDNEFKAFVDSGPLSKSEKSTLRKLLFPKVRAKFKLSLTESAQQTLKHYLLAPNFAMFGFRTLARMAQREGKLHCSRHGINTATSLESSGRI